MNGDSRLDKLLDRLEQCTGHSPTQSGKGFIARCPVATHGKGDGDRHPSLSINEGAGGRVLLKCFAGCTFDEILNALDLGVSDLLSTEKSAADEREEKETQSRVARSKNTDGYASAHEAIEALDRTIRDSRRVHEYWYENLAAQKVAAVLRYESDDGSKDFRQISKRGDRWLCKGLPRPSPIYNLPGVMNANAVFVHEGEKCCAISMALGFPSTTSMGGSNAAKGTDWSPLSGKEVVIFPDNDKPGEKFAQSVVEQLAKLQPTPTVRVVKLPGLPIAGDVCDFVKLYQGNSQDAIADINRLVSEAEHINLSFGKTVVARCLADVEEERVQWLWPGRIPLGKLTLLAGLPGSGKSTLAADLLARVSAGLPFPDAPDVVNEHGSAIVLSCEDDAADTLRPRLRIARADLRKLSVIDAVQDDGKVRGFALASDLDAIERKLQQQHDIRVILFDPLNAFTGSIDNNSEGDARSVLTPLARIAAEHNVSVIGIVHLNKSSAGMAAVHRVLGSQAWLGAARMAWLVGQDPHDDGGKVMVRLKGNLSVASGLRFRLHQPEHEQMCHVMWDDDVVDLSPEDVLNPRKTRGQDRKQAMRWLRDQLARGPLAAKYLLEQAADAGFSEKTTRRAFNEIGGQTRKSSFDTGWHWHLPTHEVGQQIQVPLAGLAGHHRSQVAEDSQIVVTPLMSKAANTNDAGQSGEGDQRGEDGPLAEWQSGGDSVKPHDNGQIGIEGPPSRMGTFDKGSQALTPGRSGHLGGPVSINGVSQ